MLALVLLSVLAVALGDEEPPLHHVERHTLKDECPHHAVCAELYRFLRYGQPERRAIYNCHCRGQEGRCQLDESRMLHDTIKRKIYFCEELRTIPQCDMSNTSQIAEEIIRNSPDFQENSFTRVKCQCPRHHNPVVPETGHLERAVVWSGNQWQVGGTYVQRYKCARERREYFNRFRPDLYGPSGRRRPSSSP